MLACVSSCCGSGTGHYSTNLFGAEAVKIITAHKPTTPLFFYLPWQGVHAPAQVREPAHGKEDWSAFDHEKAPLEDSSRLAKCNGLIQINFVDWLDFCVEIGSRALHQALRKSHCRPRPTVRFLFMTATGTHVPIETRFSSPKLNLQNRLRVFAGMLSAVDEGVGNVTKTLKAKGMWPSTIFIVTTDK